MNPHYNPDSSALSSSIPLAPSSTTVGRGGGGGYDAHDEDGGDDLEGDIPLLRRDGSHGSGYSMPRANVPGAYDDPVTPDNRSENNIRYGRIPQRVPRRYKTVKKVE
jgi:chitin synthase